MSIRDELKELVDQYHDAITRSTERIEYVRA